MKKSDVCIFLVDDDTLCLHLYQQFLKQGGYERIYIFDNGPDCIENFVALQPQVLLLDYNMDEMTGIEVLQTVKEINPACVVVFISGLEDSKVASAAKEQGALDYVIKSTLNPARMSDIMEKACSKLPNINSASRAPEPSLLKRLFS